MCVIAPYCILSELLRHALKNSAACVCATYISYFCDTCGMRCFLALLPFDYCQPVLVNSTCLPSLTNV